MSKSFLEIVDRAVEVREKYDRMIAELRGLLGNPEQKIGVKIHHTMSGLQVVDFLAHAVFRKYEVGDRSLSDVLGKKDKTLDAFAGNHPVPLQQRNYLSWLEYSKLIDENQEDGK